MEQLNKSLQGLQDLGQQFTPFAKRTARLVQERLGKAEDVTELPQEYLELEKRVDALKEAHIKLLDVTRTYENESYDYPAHLKESVVDLSKDFREKLQGVVQASSAAEAQAAVLKTASDKPPKTLSHALARAALSGSQNLPEDDLLGNALNKFATVESQLGDLRLKQDQAIQAHFNASINTTLSTSLQFATKARRNVTKARLDLDTAKMSLKNARPDKQEALALEVEQAEDDFVAATEEAVSVMKNFLETPETVRLLTELVNAQLEYHKSSAQALEALLPDLEKLRMEQESAYRASRDAA
ncbi:hypothetical protein CANCADRAFT_45636 [Tortispora caseinolytica NRRL Y-17796]|uniref:BAR domain-containing protein n=1 Tax=Tortispora caseinolytica NRRL Y-17796 TaxID=767744 RepID=A0A1E4TBP7_9ASCO|nr:hypothetical protein CANCADRAFT_45636 [Tortispora caseinolytica NRRL Y-17796]